MEQLLWCLIGFPIGMLAHSLMVSVRKNPEDDGFELHKYIDEKGEKRSNYETIDIKQLKEGDFFLRDDDENPHLVHENFPYYFNNELGYWRGSSLYFIWGHDSKINIRMLDKNDPQYSEMLSVDKFETGL